MRIVRHLGEIAAAHRLMNHQGSCELLHGHNWDIELWVEAPVEPHSGISVDFLDFDKLRAELWEQLDHGIWLHDKDPLIEALERDNVPMKLLRVAGEPTAENIAALIAQTLVERFPQAAKCGVRVSEMAGCTAEIAVDGHGAA